MLQGINPKLVKQAMKKMGIKQEDIEAKEVIIRCYDREIIISNPQVSRVDMAGDVSFQISGDISEENISKEDIKTVAEQADVSEEEAKKALKENEGDLAKAILALKGE